MKFRLDWQIILPVFLSSSLGSFIIWSVNADLLFRHLTSIAIGWIIFLIISYTYTDSLNKFWLLLYVLLNVGLLLVFLQPAIRGSQRWFFIGGQSIQISEIAKTFYIFSLAGLINSRLPRNLINFGLLMLAGVFPILLIAKQPDLGNAILYFAVLLIMIFAGYSKIRYLLLLILFLALLIPVSWQFLLKDYQQIRIISFFRPELDQQGIGYNAIQSLIAVGSGGFLGRGLGRGLQSHLRFLPESHTDFIFASLTEELGFFGGAVLLLLYAFLLYRILSLTVKTQDIFSRIFLVGVFVQLFTQIFVNIGMNLGLMPITGVTLPLISFGGSSIIATFITLGFVHALESQMQKRVFVIK